MIWCDRGIVRNPFYLGLCISKKKYKKEMKRIGIKNPPPFMKTKQANATAHFFKKSVIVCMNKQCKKQPRTVITGLLIHEAVHVWQAIKDNINEKQPSKEFEAYSIQCISQQLIWAYGELTADSKRKGENR